MHAQSILDFPKQCDDREKAVGQFIIFFLSFSVFIRRNWFKVNNTHNTLQNWSDKTCAVALGMYVHTWSPRMKTYFYKNGQETARAASWPKMVWCRFFFYNLPAPIAQLVECPLRGTEGHRFDPGLRYTKVVKNGTSCSLLGTQTYGVELGLFDPVSG